MLRAGYCASMRACCCASLRACCSVPILWDRASSHSPLCASPGAFRCSTGFFSEVLTESAHIGELFFCASRSASCGPLSQSSSQCSMNIQSASLRISCVSSMGTPYVSSSASSARLKAVLMLRRVVSWIAFIWECESMPCTDPKRQAAHTERTMSFILLTLASWPSLWRISASRLKKKSQSIASSLATCSSLARSRAPPSGTGARAPDELILGIPLYGDFGLRAHWPGL
mmetsp:Transcript_1635/g.4607  ORF Transcript_1635/g.4607 Transcript_1635/m.4607 type:complete len:229 (+) Transcript_1635:374-1060(+)